MTLSLRIRMKMKFSIVLCLLPFSLSVPPPTFPLDNLQPDCPPFEPTSPLFEISDFGLYIWRIPYLQINEGESSHGSTDFETRNYESYLSNKSSIHWPEKPELIQWVPLSQKQINVELLSKEAYILLKLNVDKTCQLSYWMGKSSTLAKRKITARFVVRIMHHLQSQITGVNLNYISREQENLESAEFQVIFGIKVARLIPRLYKLMEKYNDFTIQAVPLRYGELNVFDTFVLDEITHVKIWSASLNTRMTTIALALARYISNADRIAVTRNEDIRIPYGSENDFLTFQQEFLENLNGIPSPLQFPAHSLYSTKGRNLQLFEYFIHLNRFSWREIIERPLTLRHFLPHKTYVMIDKLVHNAFIIIGICGHTTMIENAMAYAEQFYWHAENYRWKKITIIRSTDMYPTPFIVNFNEFKSILNDYITM